MLTVNNITKKYELKIVLSQISFTIQKGERAALFGPNGCGKTTLIRIVVGEEQADQGTVQFTPSGINWFYLPQLKKFPAGITLGQYLVPGNAERLCAEKDLAATAHALSLHPENDALQQTFDQLLSLLQQPEQDPAVVADVLRQVGLAGMEHDTPVAHLSGGQQTRLMLAKMVLSKPEFLILDEPTNDLDEGMLEWLEDWLRAFPGGILFVSHDRVFLNRIATRFIELDRGTHQSSLFEGNYDDWLQRKAAAEDAAMSAWNRQRSEIRQLKSAVEHTRQIARFRKGGKADSGDKLANGFFANRSLGTIRRAKQLEERLEMLQTEKKLDKPGQFWRMKMTFDQMAETGDQVLILGQLSVGYGETALIREIDLRLTRGKICTLSGQNGSGKTTLIKTIMGEIPPLTGNFRVGSNVKIGYLPQGMASPLFVGNAFETISRNSPLNETEVRRFLSYYLFTGDEVFVPIANLSNGQRSRLSLACFAATGCNFLILDEPLNHLDVESREDFEDVLGDYPGTVLAVVHDRSFIERCADLVWSIRNGQVLQTALHD